MERVGYILANTLRYKNYDDRFSHSNKEWAEQVGTPENNARIIKFRADWVVTSHSAVLDGFVTMYREKLEKQKELEQPFVKQFYVVENRQTVPLEIKRFGNLDDAMSQYQALPNHYMKALGVEKNPNPLPGSLDVLQCMNGIDTIVEDYKTVPGWDNPYIQNHVVQPLQGALAVQDVELAYELPDAYFHIQTCDDGFDYTLYNKDFTEQDGGILETDGDKSVQEAMTELLAEFGCDAAQGRIRGRGRTAGTGRYGGRAAGRGFERKTRRRKTCAGRNAQLLCCGVSGVYVCGRVPRPSDNGRSLGSL